MPKSKRDKLVSLTRVTKRGGLEHKGQQIQLLREYVDDYKNIFVFSVENMRNTALKDLRVKFPESRFFMGKNTLVARAFGDENNEIKPDLHKISQAMVGECGLYFTNDDKDETIKYFEEFKQAEFARSGFVPIETVERHPGPIDMAHTLEPTLRKLGMTTSLKNGVIILEKEHTLCTAGEPLTPENARLLTYFGIKLATFQVRLSSVWYDGNFEEL